MPIFQPSGVQPVADQLIVADAALECGNDIAEELVNLHRRSRAILFEQPGWNVAKLQTAVDAMGSQAVLVFQASAALAQLIETHYPGGLRPDELVSAVPYDEAHLAATGQFVFDTNAKYPTEE